MKNINLVYLIGLVFTFSIFSSISHAQPTAPEGKKWVVVPELTDEFNSWDGSKWQHELWNYNVDESQQPFIPTHMVEENAGVSDGNLWIKATYNQGAERWINSSRVSSKKMIIFPMYMECSMKANSISSYNTFWLNNGDINGRDEIDMCESNANPSMAGKDAMPYTLNSQYFIVKNGVTERAHGNFNSNNLSADNSLRGVHWDEAYHTIGIWWKDARTVQFYLNGEEAGSVSTQQDFTLHQKVLWDVWSQESSWVGGLPILENLLDDTKNTMYVDWIHTYRLADAPTGINSSKENVIEVYPNPANDFVNVNLPEAPSNGALLTIYNSTGSVLKKMTLEQQNNQIGVEELPSGFYVLQILDGNTIYSDVLVK